MRTIRFIALFLGCIFNSYSWAKLIPWDAPVPSSLKSFNNDPQQLAALTGNRIFIYAHPQQSFQLPTYRSNTKIAAQFYSAAVVIPVDAQYIAKTLTHYTHYVNVFPTLKSAKILEQQGDITQVKYQVHIPTPIPILNFKENVVMQHHLNSNSISTLVVDAPIPYGAGKMEWFDLGNQQTLVTITQWGDLNHPQGFLLSKILQAIPEAKLGIPASTNAFLLEALQQKFKTPRSPVVKMGQLPELHLNSIQIQKITALSQRSQQPVSFIFPTAKVSYSHGLENLRFSRSYHYFAQAPQQMQRWLEPTSFQVLFPRQIKKMNIQKFDANTLDADYKISVGLGVINIPFDFKLRFNHSNNLANRFYAVGGDLKFIQGGMQLIPQHSGTLLQISSAMKIHDKAPFLLRAMRSLPYHEMLPAIGGNTVLALKMKQQVKE